jgi:hypothetical protein
MTSLDGSSLRSPEVVGPFKTIGPFATGKDVVVQSSHGMTVRWLRSQATLMAIRLFH